MWMYHFGGHHSTHYCPQQHSRAGRWGILCGKHGMSESKEKRTNGSWMLWRRKRRQWSLHSSQFQGNCILGLGGTTVSHWMLRVRISCVSQDRFLNLDLLGLLKSCKQSYSQIKPEKSGWPDWQTLDWPSPRLCSGSIWMEATLARMKKPQCVGQNSCIVSDWLY